MSLEQLLTEIRQRRLTLAFGRTGRVVPWSPGQRIPRQVRSAISTYNGELQWLIDQSEIVVCADPDLHRASWGYYVSRFYCDVCARLAFAQSWNVLLE